MIAGYTPTGWAWDGLEQGAIELWYGNDVSSQFFGVG